ncbi:MULTISPECIES: hypothetical protein [unclassified Streptomyces]|uniref:Uncharacterized protein n=1 Tax=Streptomyces celluloflavus TaxID=58344 RepID=A0ABW7RDL4_9ACTN|nr:MULTISPECIES: hypothetical protein [unclassified Streptomyces]MCX4395245.1 hypothetical protein [Streptomyces sp. NBC_01767]MCX4549372.1 hypothetical protein [Streptomyces sp. NBC_01500]
MSKYVINKDYGDEREVEAESYSTVGDFIDFYGEYDDGVTPMVFRVRSSKVQTVELVSA